MYNEDFNNSENLKNRTEYCKANYEVIRNYKLGFDIGANVGGVCHAFHHKFDQLVAIEAAKPTYEVLKSNISKLDNIKAINRAVHKKSGEVVKIYPHNSGDSGSSSLISIEGNSKDESYDVNTISLEDLVNTYGEAEYLKVDCEGSEYDFLIDKDLSFVHFMFMELHFDFLSEKQRTDLLLYPKKYFKIYSSKEGKPGVFNSEYNFIRKKKLMFF